ncbi:MAG: hypothetical protein AAF468_06490 [Pseudomonadota bacterium]
MKLKFLYPIPLILLVLSACSPVIGEYSLQAYKNATELKARSIALLDKSTDPYVRHQAEAEELMVSINAAYEFAAGLPRNDIAARQWNLMRSKQENLMGGFVEFWKKRRRGLSSFFVAEYRKEINQTFNYIICLEANKQEKTKCGQ